MGRFLGWALGLGCVLAISAAPAAAQVHVSVGVFGGGCGGHVAVGYPPYPVYAPVPVYYPPPVYAAPVYYPPVYYPVYRPCTARYRPVYRAGYAVRAGVSRWRGRGAGPSRQRPSQRLVQEREARPRPAARRPSSM